MTVKIWVLKSAMVFGVFATLVLSQNAFSAQSQQKFDFEHSKQFIDLTPYKQKSFILAYEKATPEGKQKLRNELILGGVIPDPAGQAMCYVCTSMKDISGATAPACAFDPDHTILSSGECIIGIYTNGPTAMSNATSFVQAKASTVCGDDTSPVGKTCGYVNTVLQNTDNSLVQGALENLPGMPDAIKQALAWVNGNLKTFNGNVAQGCSAGGAPVPPACGAAPSPARSVK